MRKKLRNFKPYEYRVYNSNNELEVYSGGFITKTEAIKWYNNHGKWLENHFNRKLILITNTHQTFIDFVCQ